MRMMRYKIFLFALFLFQSFLLKASEGYHLTTKDGLPSNHVYYVMQDSKGYMWFGTYQGVCRYDGKVFENFSLKNGLLNNDVFVIQEDYKGRIWFGSYTNELCYFDGDSIIPYEHNISLKEFINGHSVKTSIHVLEDETVYLGDAINGLIKIEPNGVVTEIGKIKRNVFKFGDTYLTSQRKKLRSNESVTRGLNVINFFEEEKFKKTYGAQLEVGKDLVDITGNLYVISTGKDSTAMVHGNFFLTDYNEKFEYRFLDFRVDYIFLDSKKRIWMGSIYNGAYAYKDAYVRNEEFHILSGYSVTHITEDFQGGYWFTTLDNGVFHFPSLNPEIRKPNLPNEKVRQIISGPDNTIFVLFENSEVWYVKDNEAKVISQFNERQIKESNHIFYDQENNTLFLKGKIILDEKVSFKIEISPLFNLSNPRSRSYKMFKNNGTLYDIRGRGIFEYQERPEFVFGSELEYNRCQSLETFNDTTWIGTLNGIFYVHNGAFGKYEEIQNNQKVTAMGANSKMIAIAVEGQGIVIKKKDGGREVIKNIDLYESLKVFDIEIDDEDYILFGTTIGLYYAFKEDGEWKVKKLSAQQADVTGSIYSVLSRGQKIFLGSEDGLVSIDKKILLKEVVPPYTYLNLTKIKGIKTKLKSGAVLKHNQNSLEIEFTCIDFSGRADRVYAWKIDRKGEEWYETKNSSLYLDRLAPGNYRILVKSYSIPKIWSKEKIFEFTIKPPFWLTWWFISSSILAFVGIIVLIIHRRGEKLRKKAETELRLMKEKNDLEMRALRAQMNPHFIFNTLTAIQNLIQSDQKEKAEYFLVKFSHLLRLVVDRSNESFVQLSDEMEVIRIYLELQNLRFGDKFSTNFEFPENKDLSKIRIPGLLIQPFVENAVEHGLSKKDGKGQLFIRIKDQGKFLLIEIEDDGIGRKMAAEINARKLKKHKSVGMSNVSRRIKIMNSDQQTDLNDIHIEDLMDEKGNVCGTLVQLKLKYT